MAELERIRREQARRALFEHYRAQGTSARIEAVGTSMRPSIDDGDWLLVDFGARDVRTGTIVLFPLGERMVVHRVIGRARRGRGPRALRTKGDARLDPDPPLAPADVLGVVRAVRPGADPAAHDRPFVGRTALLLGLLSALEASGVVAATRLPPPLRRALRLLARAPFRLALRLARPSGGQAG